MKKLWLDDERLAPSGWITSKTAGHAVMLLASGTFSEVSLDHDLGDDNQGTGYDVICWIEEKVHNDPLFVIPIVHVHTQNASARHKMIQAAKFIEKMRLKQLKIQE
jgi:hypothetical protein